MSQRAGEVYEVVVDETAVPSRRRRGAGARRGFFASRRDRRAGPDEPDLSPIGAIVRIVDRRTGADVFHHIDDLSEGESDMAKGIRADLAALTVPEFEARWVD